MNATMRWVLAVGFCLGAASVWAASDDLPNLVKNGDFEQGGANPEHWEPIEKEGIRIEDVGGEHGRVLRFDVPRDVARGPGLMYYSDYIPIETDTTYRFQMDVKIDKNSGCTSILFIKGYADFRGRERLIYKRKKEIIFDKKGEHNDKTDPAYRAEHGIVRPDEWGKLSIYFTPQSPKGHKVLAHRGVEVPVVDRIRVDLYAYGGDAGTLWFDNVRITREDDPRVLDGTKPQPMGPPEPTPRKVD